MKKCVKKSFIILLLLIFINSIYSIQVNAVEFSEPIMTIATTDQSTQDSSGQDSGGAGGDGYNAQMGALITGSWSDSSEVSGKATTVISNLVTVVKIIAVAVAIIILLTLAMKYMSAAPGEKADIKKSAIVYVVGAFILFGATGLLTLIQEFATVFS